ncbi:MAG: signal recognition particle-docking protein FtsY [Acidobacteriota bacterium]|nr:MAG: signal recognition particle-docking protein FtsY [Acidobacteriota bacterium]
MSIFNYKEKPGYFSRLKKALESTKEDISQKIGELTGSGESPVTPEQLENLEEVLLAADIGVQTTLEIIEKIQDETRGNRFVTSFQVKRLIREELATILQDSGAPDLKVSDGGPFVMFVVGVNGVGKTTTIGKLASLYRSEGSSVLFSASDTFRAAAIEQLTIWAERTGASLVKQSPGADPAAVLFDAIQSAKSRAVDVLIVDTAGRLHTKSNLMQELEKMNRVAAREVDSAPHEVLLVLDATTGQNGLVQAREFHKSAGVTGLLVTKLDGTAKGGIVVAIAKELGIPIRFVGVGEKADDLLPFDPQAYIDSLLGSDKSR